MTARPPLRPGNPGTKKRDPMSFFLRISLPDVRLDKRYEELQHEVSIFTNIILRGEAVSSEISAQFEYSIAAMLTAPDFARIVEAIKAALLALSEKLWPDGKRAKWWKWVMAIPEIALFLISMFKALTNQPAK